MGVEDEADSEEVSKTEEAMEVEVGEVLDSVVDSVEATVVGMEAQMEAQMVPLLQTRPLDQEVVEVDLEGSVMGSEELSLQIATAHRLVGMIRVVVVAHMMTETAVTVVAAAEATAIETEPLVVEVEATWSR